MVVLGFILLFGEPTVWAALRPDVFEVHELHNISSPTTILRVGKKLFLGADYLAARPGLYRLSFVAGTGYQAGLLKILPQQAVEGLQLMEDGSILVVSGRYFSADAEDWVGQLISLDPRQYQLIGRTEMVQPDNICSDGTRNCGLADIVFLSDKQILAFTKKGPAKVYLLIRNGEDWIVQKSLPVFSNRKAVTISEVKRIDGRIVCLLKNRWMLAACLPQDILADGSWKLELEPVFNFRPIRKRFRIEDATVYFYGLAEGFDFDTAGNLLVLLNNRGYAFRKSPDGKLGRSPKLLLFPKKVPSALPKPEQNPDNR